MGELMVGVSGIRGIVGDSLTPPMIIKYVSAFSDFIGPGTIVLGRDSRVTGSMFSDMVASVLASKGHDVLDVGIAATPTVLLEILRQEASGGIVVTASHNPREWNALKLAGSRGLFLTAEESAAMLKMAGGDSFYSPWDAVGKKRLLTGASQRHVEDILALVDVEKIRKRGFKVVLDCVNGAGGVITPMLLQKLGCDVKIINGEPDGMFPRNPEPVAANLSELERETLSFGADVGFAHDPDVDRLSLVSEAGRAIGEEYTLAFAVMNLASKRKGDVVCNLSTSGLTAYASEDAGCSLIRTPVGEVNVAEEMRKRDAVAGGEGNGGVIDPRLHLTRDAPMAVALILELMAERDASVEALADVFPAYVMIKEKQVFDDADARRAAMRAVASSTFDEQPSIDERDGLRLDFNEGWVHVRQSGTEPALRFIGESTDREWILNTVATMKRAAENT